jgi:hypothetical protein
VPRDIMNGRHASSKEGCFAPDGSLLKLSTELSTGYKNVFPLQ